MAGAGSDDAQAQRNAAIEAYHRGEANALSLISDALARNPHDGGLLISDAALRLSRGEPDALSRMERMIAQAPDWVDGQVALAGFRWESGDTDGYLSGIETALAKLPRHAGLWKSYISLLAGSGKLIAAADAARMARQKGFDMPMLRLIEAMHSGAGGDLDRAEALLADLPREIPDLPQQLARHLLRTGEADAAVVELDEARRRHPDDISNWALTEIAWRLTEDERHDWLVGEGKLAGPLDLGPAETDLSALADCLRDLHASGAAPIGQSVRSGTQTRGDIFKRMEPPIAELRKRLKAAVAEFWSGLPQIDPAHPLLRHRDATPRFVTGWSIRILGGGFHVSHIHPGGVLSSAFYVAVPDTLDAKTREGWIELGRPPDDLQLDLGPFTAFGPKPGRLVLFPSYLYHGTRPFSAGERMSVAFDIAPA
ncbi:putative 2OG-Fe(II) oxygenase [Parasphingopyxis sp.]|uniref:putative 2OG-Fe(II) oxygenase n=1 Tax=Parasphingopyxis sp. TaxID=1920299 RepID=UPI00262A648F|nr:putative 2OG-Fe(II) oxygenase [Parasphingopyxis sp.]